MRQGLQLRILCRCMLSGPTLDKLSVGPLAQSIKHVKQHGGDALLEAIRSNPKQAEALRKSDGKRAWISARDVRAFYSTQEVAQLYRDAPALSRTRVKVPKAEDLRPLSHRRRHQQSLMSS